MEKPIADVNGFAPTLFHPEDAEKFFAKSAGKPYRPSNGSEGDLFQGLWCAGCQRDAAFRNDPDNNDGCAIVANTMAYDREDSEYPREWQYSSRGQPICTAFQPIAKVEAPRVMDLKPCPFCAGEPSPTGKITYSANHDARWLDGTRVLEAFFVNCVACGVDNRGLLGHQTREAAVTAWNRRAPAEARSASPWQPIATAPRDGTVFVGCNLDHPSFGSWAMYRRVRHTINDGGEAILTDLGGWAIIHDLSPDYHEGAPVGPGPDFAIAQDEMNRSVRYGWQPLPTHQPKAEADHGK